MVDKKYYLKNIVISLFYAAIGAAVWSYNNEFSSRENIFFFVFLMSSIPLFPLARWLVESVALKFSRKEFWMTGIFKDDIGKNGIYALYYFFIMVMAIPLGLVKLICITVKKRPI
jgi:hypothetical protein